MTEATALELAFFPPLFHHRVKEWPCRSWNTKVTVARPVVGVGAPYCTQICDRCSGSLRWNWFKLPQLSLILFGEKDRGWWDEITRQSFGIDQRRFKMIKSFQIRPLKLPSTHGWKHHFRKKHSDSYNYFFIDEICRLKRYDYIFWNLLKRSGKKKTWQKCNKKTHGKFTITRLPTGRFQVGRTPRGQESTFRKRH